MLNPSRIHVLLAGALLGAPGAPCAAGEGELPAPVGATLADLRALEPTVGDVGPLGVGLRQGQADLRLPTDFERVYDAPSSGGSSPLGAAGSPRMLMRRNGALTAVFPRSEYVGTRTGPVPVVPAGTVWVIGDPGRESSPGCTERSTPACRTLPAQGPFLMPGPTRAAPTARREPPAGAVGPDPAPRAGAVGQPISTPTDTRLGRPLRAAPAARAGVEPTAGARSTPMPAMDLSDPFYRRARLMQIARRYGTSP